ncbi:MAG: carbohydrate binding family 9 domain-containing protein [Acidobacteria bacterium]|nr:carbohydrate binding family 9 domain-containing protein [Acidobacteriota bacterium]
MSRRALCPWMAVVALLAAAPATSQTLPVSSSDGRRTLTAVRAPTPVIIDGVLDDAVWQTAPAAEAFVQADPREGQPASEATEAYVAFDDEFLYIGARCRDSNPAGIVVNDIHKDFAGTEQDTFEVLLDTFADRRNGFVFATNAAGARADTQIANEGRDVNPNWDAVWWVASAITAEGWTTEFRIPFKTLRFEPGDGHLWGLNFARRIRRKNEVTYWSPVARAFSIVRASSAGTLGGLPDLAQGRNIRVKPYVLGGAVRPLGGTSFALDRSAGLDVKAGLSPSLTLDATVNPDFAQAEADEQQVNLTQFSLFFPEKREFFLENSGVFYFGDIPRNQRQTSRFRAPEEDLLLFFSRRIGLTDDGAQVPLYGGLRVTGRAGNYGLGALSMQSEGSGDRPGQNYSVARVRRDVFGNADIGAIVMSRQSASDGGDYNRVAGIDANFRVLTSLSLNGFVARSDTPGEDRGQGTAKGSIGWEDSRLRLQYSLMNIDEGFKADMGFVRRTGIRRHFVDWASFLQPEWLARRGIRQVQPHARSFFYYAPNGDLATRQAHMAVQVTWNNGSRIEYALEPRTEAIARPFNIRSGVAIPVGRYDWTQHLWVVESDHSRALSLSARITHGDFWRGRQKNVQTSLLYRPNHRLFLDVGLQVTDITLDEPQTSFVTTLVNWRSGYSFNTNMFLDALVQYRNDVRQFSSNVRFNLIHRPLSDFFLVYNEQQDTDGLTSAGRGLVVKYTHLFSF